MKNHTFTWCKLSFLTGQFKFEVLYRLLFYKLVVKISVNYSCNFLVWKKLNFSMLLLQVVVQFIKLHHVHHYNVYFRYSSPVILDIMTDTIFFKAKIKAA